MYSFFLVVGFSTAVQYEFVSLKLMLRNNKGKKNKGAIKSTTVYYSHERNVFRMSIWKAIGDKNAAFVT